MSETAKTTPRLPNNRLHGRAVQPALAWNDGEILSQAAATAAPDGKPVSGSAAQAKVILALFGKHGLDAPTYWAAIQWVRRREIPDRWRPTVVYMLMRDQRIATNRLFRKAASTQPLTA